MAFSKHSKGKHMFEIIHSYTRRGAICDGVLVEVPAHLAGEAGFRCHVALTAAAWADCVEWREEDTERKAIPQDLNGRLWDVLWMARCAAVANPDTSQTTFAVYRIVRYETSNGATKAHLVLHIGPGDEGEPVATIMQVGED